MSGLLSGKVWLSDLPRKLKPLAATLADIANDDGTSIYPSVAYVAWRLSSSERFVQDGMAKLRALRVLEVVANSGGGRSLTVEYRMMEESLPSRPPWCRARKGANRASFSGSEMGALQDRKDAIYDTKGCNSRHERVQASAPDPSVSCSDPSVSAPLETGRQSNYLFQKLSSERAFPFPKRPTDSLRSDLYGGINWKRIENVFFDTKNFPFEKQLIAAVGVATTDLVLNRTGKMMVLQATDIEKLAVDKLFRGLETLMAVTDFTRRARVSRDAIGNAVISAAAELLEGKEGGVPA
jgi:hypothetical protein